ncbi:MAG TPA: F0F1 ATP synthase subunit beta, partial [Phycisphaerales bacterium]|nr:F0F1 ATP synthase subunit beta [Phycisphaerales bacterium]
MSNTGTIIQVIGSTFDAQFSEDSMPEIYNAVECEIDVKGQKTKLVGEVSRHMGGGQVRCVALASTDGLSRGQQCVNTGSPVMVPVGEAVLGRVFNLLGQPVDNRGPVNADKKCPIHREPPKFLDLNPKTQILETGIKVSDLLCPVVRGGTIGLFGGAGVGTTVGIPDMIARVAR